MSVALDLPLEHFDRLFQLRMALPKRAPAVQPFVRGQTGVPAVVDALAGGQVSELRLRGVGFVLDASR